MTRRRPTSGTAGAGTPFSSIPTGAAAPAASPVAPTADPDDDGFGVGVGGDESVSTYATLTPLGPTIRPNGETYWPRYIGPHEDLAWLRACRDEDEHVLFYGPPGTGKTALAEAPWAPDAKPGVHFGFESMLCTGDTSGADFTGTWVQNPTTGAFTWSPGPLQRAIDHDVPLYVDEIFLAPPQVLSVLYSAMDGRGVLRITANPDLEPLKIGPGFVVIAAGNPDVPGAVFSDALRSRFHHHVEVTTDWDLAAKLRVPGDIRTVAKNLDRLRRLGEIGWSPQLRDLLVYAKACKRHGQTYALQALVAKAPREDRDVIANALKAKFGDAAATPLTLGARHGGR